MLSCKEEKRPSIRSLAHPPAPRQAWYISFHKTGRSRQAISRKCSLRHLLYFGRRECRVRLIDGIVAFFRLLSLCLHCCILYLWMYLSSILGPNRPILWPGVYNWVTGTPQNFTRTRVFASVCGSSPRVSNKVLYIRSLGVRVTYESFYGPGISITYNPCRPFHLVDKWLSSIYICIRIYTSIYQLLRLCRVAVM